ncbi:MAG: ATP-binding protein [Gammaproteobacteria bacterium]|nr:ATP-binding protein [Gammaproteobacteria bacterium]
MKRLIHGSIHARLLVAASLVLSAFLGVTGFALEQAFRSSAEEALKARLQSSVYAILAAAEEDEAGRLTLPKLLTDPRLNMPDSGLYASVIAPELEYRWHSASSIGLSLNYLQMAEPGQSRFQMIEAANSTNLMTLSFGVVWEDFSGAELSYILAVAEDLRPHLEQIGAFRNTLLLWLGGAALLLLLVQGWVLGWGLQPLRSIAEELRSIESGQSDQLSGRYPKELRGLARNINSLIRHAQARQQRYRDSLGDLAHSLKTPLAILQGLADQQQNIQSHSQVLTEQVSRMNQIVGHQLHRAAASGRNTLVKKLQVKPMVERIARTMDKVYRDKDIVYQVDVTDEAGFMGDEGDLMEVLGNLMDNAWKYGAHRVRISGRGFGDGLELCVEDDGKGITQDQVNQVVKRGRRMDEQAPGQGIGLAVVEDILKAYGGGLTIDRSELGGARLSIHFEQL